MPSTLWVSSNISAVERQCYCIVIFFFFSTFHLLLSTQGVGQQGRRDVTLSIIYSRGLTLDLNLCEHMLASRIAGFEALFSSVHPSNPES